MYELNDAYQLQIRELGNNGNLPLPLRIERLENHVRDLTGELQSILSLLGAAVQELQALKKEAKL